MKKLTALLLSLVILLLAACGEIDGIDGKTPTIPSGGDSSDVPEGTDPSTLFTVKLIYEDEVFTATDGIKVQWANATSVHRASFDSSDNIAKIAGLDGDYTVTLVGLPDNYIYDTNIYTATNLKKNIEIEIFDHISPRGSGSELYKCIEITRVGGYTTPINSKDHTVYYQFTPSRSGTYVVETIVDVSFNEINPFIDVYTGTGVGAKYYYRTVDSGGVSSTYTRNARYVIEVDSENVGQDYTFSISATHKTGIYPANVSFLIKYAGSYSNPAYNIESTVIIPDQQALASRGMIMQPSGTLTYPETKVASGVYVLDSSRFALNDDDGYYHLYNEATGKYDGPILYAKITRRHRFFADYQGSEVSFAGREGYSICVEDPGNKALQVLEDGTENYKLFIQGSAACSDVVGMESYTGYKGYAEYIDKSNTEGVYPVTEELRGFLQKFAVSQRYFNDGNGWAESTAENELGYRIYADEEDQWLFACCYYV